MSTAAALLSLQGVSRSFGEREALRPLDLAVAPGERVALLGSNGSGKSTLLRIACGRDRPTTGTVTFDGAPMSEDDIRVRARVAVVGDALTSYPDLTVRQHLELVAVAHSVAEPEAGIAELLRAQSLSEHADAVPGTLSSGQTQAMLLASALLRPRDLLLLDEPEQRLDPRARDRLAELISAEGERGTAVLFATHHRELARTCAHRALLLDEGALAAEGTPAEVLATLDPLSGT
ncbi:ATP-binding cassette domain-containing protein [Streptomyces iconiensis]|uniref:ABC transporter ATP-binding protein n=1 Tax=Streptomyces iconiensis TaxID=1384038 RepID=A0ABT6ZR08_9ACTN|nr:ABC transporter ATP-binding protein [Streptomyces iconiensis]MDJ1130963.1 ABC transporter ATP-binding protein [Streptomyces iconiensis]